MITSKDPITGYTTARDSDLRSDVVCIDCIEGGHVCKPYRYLLMSDTPEMVTCDVCELPLLPSARGEMACEENAHGRA